MKKIISIIAIAATTISTSCRKGDVDSPIVSGERTVELVTYSADPDSRTQYADGEGMTWTADDKTLLGVTSNVDTGKQSSEITIGEDKTATFAVSGLAGSATDIITYYPFIEGRCTDACDNGTKDYTITETVPAEQTQAKAGVMTGSNATMISAKPIHVSDGTGGVFDKTFENKMTMTSAILRFRVYDAEGKYADDSVCSVEVVANDGVKVNGKVVAKGKIDTSDAPAITYEEGTTASKVTLSTMYALKNVRSVADAKGIYLAAVPFVTKGIAYKVTTVYNTFTFELAKDATIACEAGKIYDIALNLAKATKHTELTAEAPVADLLDVVFGENCAANDVSAMQMAIDASCLDEGVSTQYSERYGRYVAVFSSDPIKGAHDKGFWKVPYTTRTDFAAGLEDGYSIELLFARSNAEWTANQQYKPFAATQAGGTGLCFRNTTHEINWEIHTGGTRTGVGYKFTGGAWRELYSGVVPEQNIFYHTILVWSKETGKAYCYVNGKLTATKDAAGEFDHMVSNVNSYWFGIGADPNASDKGELSFQGTIVLARIYNDPLSPLQVKALYQLVE